MLEGKLIVQTVRRWFANQNRREAIAGDLFILPTFVGYTAFVVGPVFAAIGFSFTDYDALSDPKYNGLANYREILHDVRLHTVYRNTFYFTFVAVAANIGIGLLLAVLLNRA